MTKRITAILLALSICLTAIPHSIAGEESLRSTLEKTEEVFTFEPKDNIEGRHNLEFSVDN